MCGKSALTASGGSKRTDAIDSEDGNLVKTSLQQATTGKHLELMERPLQAEAHANACAAASGRTVLQAAEEGEYVDAVAQLVRAGAKRTKSLETS